MLDIDGIDEDLLDSTYESVQSYIEREIEPENMEEEIDLSSLGIDLKLENNQDGTLEEE